MRGGHWSVVVQSAAHVGHDELLMSGKLAQEPAHAVGGDARCERRSRSTGQDGCARYTRVERLQLGLQQAHPQAGIVSCGSLVQNHVEVARGVQVKRERLAGLFEIDVDQHGRGLPTQRRGQPGRQHRDAVAARCADERDDRAGRRCFGNRVWNWRACVHEHVLELSLRGCRTGGPSQPSACSGERANGVPQLGDVDIAGHDRRLRRAQRLGRGRAAEAPDHERHSHLCQGSDGVCAESVQIRADDRRVDLAGADAGEQLVGIQTTANQPQRRPVVRPVAQD